MYTPPPSMIAQPFGAHVPQTPRFLQTPVTTYKSQPVIGSQAFNGHLSPPSMPSSPAPPASSRGSSFVPTSRLTAAQPMSVSAGSVQRPQLNHPPAHQQLHAAPSLVAQPVPVHQQLHTAHSLVAQPGPIRAVVTAPVVFNRRAYQSFSQQLAVNARFKRATEEVLPRPQVALDEDVLHEIKLIYERVTSSGGPGISRLDLVKALQSDATVSTFLLPGFDCSNIMSDHSIFEASQSLFNDIAKGKPLITLKVFLNHFRNVKVEVSSASDLLDMFTLLDTNGDGRISRHELFTVLKSETVVAKKLLKDCEHDGFEMDDTELHDAIDELYKSIAGNWKYFDFADFLAYFRASVDNCGSHIDIVRADKRVLIIGPGFGTRLNPLQTEVVNRAGFQVHWLHDLPNPEENNFLMLSHAGKVKQAIDQLKPDLVMAGSKGGAYLVALWQMGYWRGPTVMLNAHPSCTELPKDVPIVMTQGDLDEVYYERSRADLEALISTGTPNKCFLYYAASSGKLPTGQVAKPGDSHNMATLCVAECLPRLMDAAMCPEGPELHMTRGWVERMGRPRIDAERRLGLVPSNLQHHWATRNKHEESDEVLFDVPRGSAEFNLVQSIFKTPAKDPSAYGMRPGWDRVGIVRLQRIENTMQGEGGAQPYYNSVRKSFNSQGIEFVPGVHTRWLFHGSDAVESIVNNPVNGFQPLVSGTRGATLWGLGTYFARDADYVASGPFCGQPAQDGTRKMLLCLATVGMSCVGNPAQKGVLPMRQPPHRYNSSVDSLSSPEIYILQHPGAAYPAYVITFL
eukprot:TRINITY_DN22233_c0_g1_i1.p1 TRINITY_DN22233_c0_g1~~TRINITY_DN22233_c0_g1_i1.p1  ORF type:complete len:796 (-),score=80.30 TRINITY_DN22233_c0_g1_i1:223-2610(-)